MPKRGSRSQLLCDKVRIDCEQVEKVENLVARAASFLARYGFSREGYTGLPFLPLDLFLSVNPRDSIIDLRDSKIRREARRILWLLERKGIVPRDPEDGVRLMAATMTGPLPAWLRRGLVIADRNISSPRKRGAKVYDNRGRDLSIAAAVDQVCALGELDPTRSRESKKRKRAESGASIIALALRQIGGVRLSEQRIEAIWRKN
jgi:hypothetical protein